MTGDISKPTRSELIAMLDEMVKNIESLPLYAMTSPISNYDHCALIILLSSIFKSETKTDKHDATVSQA